MRRPTGKVLLFGSIGAVIVALMLLVDGGGVFSHSGRTDSSGGHYNRQYGDLPLPRNAQVIHVHLL